MEIKSKQTKIEVLPSSIEIDPCISMNRVEPNATKFGISIGLET
ncbi:hypothetical protein LEP1GSC071_1628 [Leptospira santarosai str. JET]|nr:hypothetical protein LEP1GSC071_1628 [Leptospira santarosai str. JET]